MLCKTRKINKDNECSHSFTVSTEVHKPISVALVIVDRDGEIVKEFSYTGDDVVEMFIEEVLDLEETLLDVTRLNKYMIISEQQQKEFELSDTCYICLNHKNGLYKPFTKDDKKTRDHCHISGTLDTPHGVTIVIVMITLVYQSTIS